MKIIKEQISKIILISSTSCGGLWLILETLAYFGIKPFENSGLLGYVALILSSLYLGLVIVFIKYLVSKDQRNQSGNEEMLEFTKIHTNKREAQSSIIDSISKSSNISIITGRGNELQRETYGRIFESPHKFNSIRVLLPNPSIDNSKEKIDWLDQREKEVIAFDKSFTANILRGQINTNITFIKHTSSKNSNFSLRLYNLPHLGLITLTDDKVFFYFLKSRSHGRDCKMFECSNESELYKSLSRYYNEVWKKSDEIQ